MKKAVIVVGPHYSGKSKTIRKYFKRLIGLTERQRAFDLRGKNGCVLSQSPEEKRFGRVISQSAEEKRLSSIASFLARYLSCHWLVLAARPESEPDSLYTQLVATLKRHGFQVRTIEVTKGQPESFYKQRAHDILAHLT